MNPNLVEIKPQNRAGTESLGWRKYFAHIGVNCGFMFSLERIGNLFLKFVCECIKIKS